MFALEKPDEPSSSSSSSSRAKSAANPSAGGDRVDEKDDCVKTEADNDGRPTAEYGPDHYYGNAVDCYMWKRDVEAKAVDNPYFTNRAVLEYVNLKFIENNFRTIGLNKIFDKNCLLKAQIEFQAFEQWFFRKQKSAVGKIYVNICLPLFCHLYLDLYSQVTQDRMLKFLDTFKHLFLSPKNVVFLQELKSFTGNDSISSNLSLFRKNKFVLSTSSVFLSNLFSFFESRTMLKSVFQEWFDVDFNTDGNETVVLNKYCFKTLPNKFEDELDQNVTNNVFSKRISNNEEKHQECPMDYKYNDKQEFTGNNKRTSESSFEDSVDSYSESSFSDDEVVNHKFMKNKNKSSDGLPFKSSCHIKTSFTTKIDFRTLDEDLHLCATRQITLTNCSKLSCSILTSDHKFVAAGSLDSLIYLWERSNVPTELERNSVINNIECETSKSDKPPYQSSNFIEHLDKSSATILRGHGGSIFDLAELPTAKILISASCDKTFRVWDLVSKRCLEVYNEHEYRTWCVTACPYSLQVVTGSCDGNGCLWYLNYKRPLRIFSGHLDDVLVVKFHPNQVFIATGSADKTVRVFELVTGICIRLFVGHKDYVTCLEFHEEKPNFLASASGAGEIILWDMPTGEIQWRIKVENVLFSDLAWLSNNVILASLTTGVILKCDITENYMNTSTKVKGFSTNLNRLFSLKIIDTLVYTVGIPAKFTPMEHPENATKAPKNEPQQRARFSRSLSPFKLFSSQSIIENDDNNTVKSKLKLNSPNLQNELTIDPRDTTLLTPEFFEMDLHNLPFDITSDEVDKLNSQYVVNNAKLLKGPLTRTKTTTKSTPRTSARRSRQMSKSSATTTNTSQMVDIQQSENHQPSIKANLHSRNYRDPAIQIINTGIQNNSQPHTNGETNLPNSVLTHQQSLLKKYEGTSKGVDQQQLQLRPIARARTRSSKLPNQKSVLQQELLLPQDGIKGNNHVTSPNVSQQHQLQQQTTIRMANKHITQTKNFNFNTQNVSTTSVPGQLTVRQQKPTARTPSPKKGGYRRLSPSSVASLLCTNPETLVSNDQNVLNKVTESDNSKSNSHTESIINKNIKK